MLQLIAGPAGGGKSQLVVELVEAGEVEIVADVTRIWAAVGGYERPYPVRESGDPALSIALYAQVVVARRALEAGVNVAVTTSRRNQEERWRELAEEAGQPFGSRVVDPGEAVVRARLAGPDGVLHEACETAIGRWYS